MRMVFSWSEARESVRGSVLFIPQDVHAGKSSLLTLTVLFALIKTSQDGLGKIFFFVRDFSHLLPSHSVYKKMLPE